MVLTLEPGAASVSALALLLVKATLLLVAALGVSALLQRASAGARHLVWVAIVGALLVLPALAAWSPLRLAILPAGVATAGPAVGGVPNAARAPAPAPLPNAASEVSATQRSTRSAGATQDRSISPWQLAATIWAVIALAVGAWLAFGFLAVRRIVRHARPLEEREWTGPLYEIADRLGIDATPRVMRSELVKMPFACGLLSPCIILPAESDGWDLDRRRAVLMHELAHIRRRDLVGHTLGRFACALYWFHPLVWTAVRRLRIESERACDDLALTCGLRATSYAEHLLDIVTNVGKSRTPAIAIPMAHRREFEGRMLAILDPDLRRRVGRRQSAALIGTLIALVVVVGAAAPVERSAPRQSNFGGAPPASIASDSATHAAQVQVLNKRTDTATVTREQNRTVTFPARPTEHNVPELDRDAAAVNPQTLQAIAQDTGRSDRAGILINVLRSDSSANLRRVAAWGLSRSAERADVAAALAIALRRDANNAVREMSAWSLAHGAERQEAVDALAEAVRRDDDAEVRETAAWALGNLDAERAVDALSDALSGSSFQMRMLAIWAIGNASPKSAPSGVINALSDANKEVRTIAAWALFRIEDPESVGALERALSREEDRELRMGYIRALGAIGERSSAALARLIDSRDPEVRAVVVEALAGKGGGPWPWPWPNPRPSP